MINSQNSILASWNDACYDQSPSAPWSDPSLYDNNNSNDCPPGTILRLPNAFPGKDNYGHIRRLNCLTI